MIVVIGRDPDLFEGLGHCFVPGFQGSAWGAETNTVTYVCPMSGEGLAIPGRNI